MTAEEKMGKDTVGGVNSRQPASTSTKLMTGFLKIPHLLQTDICFKRRRVAVLTSEFLKLHLVDEFIFFSLQLDISP